MAVLLVAEHPSEKRVEHTFLGEVDVGHADGPFVLRGDTAVSAQHARFFERDTEIVVRDLRSATGTMMNGTPIVMDSIVTPRDVVTIGQWRLEARPIDAAVELVPRSEHERELLTRLMKAPDDDDLARVYGDWLEENGFAAEAELLLLERELAARPGDPALRERIRLVAPRTPRAWRMHLGRLPIEGCKFVRDEDDEPDAECPRSWEGLAPMTGNPGVRSCRTCGRNVYFANSITTAKSDQNANKLIVVDSALPRTTGDLTGPVARRHLGPQRLPPAILGPPPPGVPTSPLDLPFFDVARPATVGELFASFGLGAPTENLHAIGGDRGHLVVPVQQGSPPLTYLIARFSVEYGAMDPPPTSFGELAPRGYQRFQVSFRLGADVLESWLTARFGAPMGDQIAPDKPETRDRSDGYWVFHRLDDINVGPDGCSFGWSETPPE